MNNRIDNSFNGTTFGKQSNINILSDNNNNAVSISNLPDKDDLFAQLRHEIETTVKDEIKKEQALDFSDNLKNSIDKNDVDGAKKYIKWLVPIIQGSAALTTIAKNLGLI